MKISLYDVIRSPQITEKGEIQVKQFRKYAFEVHKQANKKQVQSAVEKIFNVHVTKVHVMNLRGKWRRVRHQPGLTADWKKAVVTLKEGEKIDLTT